MLPNQRQAQVLSAMGWSSKLLLRAWPKLASQLGGGRLVPVEGKADLELTRLLDVDAGHDAFQILENGRGMRGIANRSQATPKTKPFGTLTIRGRTARGGRTELLKRRDAVFGTDGLLYPPLTSQIYARGNPWDDPVESLHILQFIVVRTDQFYRWLVPMIEREMRRHGRGLKYRDACDEFEVQLNQKNGEKVLFIAARVTPMRDAGVEVYEWTDPVYQSSVWVPSAYDDVFSDNDTTGVRRKPVPR